MLEVMEEMGLKVEKHHHEVVAQHELGIEFGTLVNTADNLQLQIRGPLSSPRRQIGDLPVETDRWRQRLGMHCHQSIWRDGKPLFAGNGYADLSKPFTTSVGSSNTRAPSTPFRTRPPTATSVWCRPRSAGFVGLFLAELVGFLPDPTCQQPQRKRVEVRFLDAAGNPYLTFSAMLMAGSTAFKKSIRAT